MIDHSSPLPTSIPESEPAFRYVHSSSFAGLLKDLRAALLVTTYQAGKLIVVRAAGGRLSTLLRTFDQPMGLAADARRLAVGTRNAVWFLRNAPDLAGQLDPPGQHDACYLPRSCHVTGDIRGHEIAWGTPHPQPLSPEGRGEELWVVNTRFSCLCTLHPDYSFVPRWMPPFVSSLAAEDRCHLNGLALADGRPRYVTALGETDTPDGWRPGKAGGGCVLDVPAGTVVARGLSMPHSPRFHQGSLWLLESGRGRLLRADPVSGRTEPVAELPGYTRGLAFADRFAFVGLSRIRETSTFGGLPLAERLKDLKCGVWVVDVGSGQTVALLEFEKGVEEIFDVQLLPGLRFPALIGFQKETIDGAYVIPRGAHFTDSGSPRTR
jgi:uncharacterized protein (TIGR03032 family)